jgi:KDO2-lipid IV(A) lauroyltransferase
MKEPELSFAQKLRYGTEAAGFFLLMGIFGALPLDTASRLGGWMGRKIFSRLPPDRIARANLKAAFPEKSEDERDAIRMAMWDNLGRVVAEYPHLGEFKLGPGGRIHAEDHGASLLAFEGGCGVMFLSGHLANWEMMPVTGQLLGFDGATVVRHPNNPYVARWIAGQRAIKGPKDQIGKHSGARRVFGQLRAGKAIYMLVDQRNDEGIAVPFFGRDAMTTPVPAALALRTGAQIRFASNRRRKGQARFDIKIHPGPDFTPSGDDAADTRALTEQITMRIEELIRAEPGQWLWIHNRWK